MLHEFLAHHKATLVQRCKHKSSQRSSPEQSLTDLQHGVPLFLDQVIKTLKLEQTVESTQSHMVSGPPGGPSEFSEMGQTAKRHGRELSLQGFTVEEVVHNYGDLCQAITDLAFELDTPFLTDEFRTLNRCLDNAIADAVTEYSHQRNIADEDREGQAMNQRLGFLAHELRNHINTATLAVTVIKSGKVGFSGATGAVLDRSLINLRSLIDRTLAQVRLTEGMATRKQLIYLADFVAEVKASATLEAESRGCELSVPFVDRKLAVEADRDLLFSAVGNLLQNAFKFTHAGTTVSLTAYAAGDRIRIDVQDHCGGLPAGDVEEMFQPFKQKGKDKSGVGLGLSICRRSVEANKGVLSVRDLPGSGCIFTIDLPRGEIPDPTP